MPKNALLYLAIIRFQHWAIINFSLHSTTVTNVALGTSLIFRSLSAVFWVFIAYCIFDFCTYVVLTIIFTVKSCVSDDPGNIDCVHINIATSQLTSNVWFYGTMILDRKKLAPPLTECCIPGDDEECNKKDETELQQAGADKTEKDEEKPRKQPSKDSPLRWASLIIYLVIAVPLVIVSIVLVAAL